MDSSWLFIVLAVGAGGVLFSLVVTARRNWQRRFQLFAYQSELRVSDEIIAAAVIRRFRRTDTGSAIGCLVGLLVSALLVVLVNPVDLQFFVWATILPVLLLCQTAGALASSLGDELFVSTDHAPRVARSNTVSIRDYVSPARFWLVPALLLAAVIVGCLGRVLSGSGLIDSARFLQSPAVWVVLTALVLGIGGAIAARVVIDQDQPASDPLELAWSDALRADTFRNLWVFESIVGWLAVVLAGIGILLALPSPIGVSGASTILTLAGNVGILALSCVFNYGAGRSYFRHRLWPSLGDVGEIVDDSDEDSAAAADAEIEERRS